MCPPHTAEGPPRRGIGIGIAEPRLSDILLDLRAWSQPGSAWACPTYPHQVAYSHRIPSAEELMVYRLVTS
jgi:hypothetical protein